MSHFFAYLSRMRLIWRWGLMRNTQKENKIPEGTLVFDDLSATVEYLLKS